ncbi:glycosyltransferase [Agreia sp. VKM Ac-1783]|uniref:glycosyltransferase n=1 Tax=Agreia sp. VKM Ac-1783 TaxID=1938889 RepID=UPI000A2ACDDB|nr:glycosyltransferase [Agreia sp. VKM Ac-1783]SMQ75473.1 glycosyltransferase, MGT family [Agreia sp. VKM Ac-1783]
MTLLVISPDYASHLLPLATLATAWLDRGDDVVVASGPATSSIASSFGFRSVELRLGRGSNPGTIRAEEQPAGEDDSLRGFFDATRRGLVDTLAYQASQRTTDLLWQPLDTASAVLKVIDEVKPDAVIVDHLAFTARLALQAAGIEHADVVLGHPTALPIAGEVYGYPTSWPRAFEPDSDALERLRASCIVVRDRFTEQWNDALGVLDASAASSSDAFAEHGDTLLLNYPGQLHDPERTAQLATHAFLGSAVRDEPADPEVDAWLSAGGAPIVYVSFGSFLSVRADVLSRVADALRQLDVRVALAIGSADRRELGELPDTWLVREFLPQVTMLKHAALAVTHGGNNSVTEAATAGVPMLVLPFSTDQFAGAEAVESRGYGLALAPNTASVDELRAAAQTLLTATELRDRSRLLGAELRATPGRDRAYEALSS